MLHCTYKNIREHIGYGDSTSDTDETQRNHWRQLTRMVACVHVFQQHPTQLNVLL